ncbi:MAG: carboxypeptidase regulatory-like domain-containing protein [Myxococcaceae bacterium]|nr:carboxypeptidase regulatory-like domain-containing protein [Myxococcaceae bacterium]
MAMAQAEPVDVEPVGSSLGRAALRLRLGLSLREGQQVDLGPGLTYSGLTPNDLAVWGVFYGLGPEWLGGQASVQREAFTLFRESERVSEGSLLRVSAGVAARRRLGPIWGELSAGYGFAQLPVFAASDTASPVFQRGGRHAALLGGRLRFPIFWRVQGELRGEVPLALAAQDAAGGKASSSGFSVAGSVLIPLKQVAHWQGALVLDYQYLQDRLTADSGPRAEQTLQRVGAALELSWSDARAPSPLLSETGAPGALALQVLDAETGAPLAGAEVRLVVRGEALAPRVANAKGQVVEPELTPGEVVAQITAEGYAPAEGRVTVTSGERATLEVRPNKLPPEVGSLKIVVVDKRDNQPLTDVPVVVGGKTLRTDAAGQVKVGGLAPGPVMVNASAPEFQAVEEAAVIVSGKEAELAIPLVPAKRVGFATISGQVRSTQQGRPLAATLVIPTARVRTRADAQGSFSLKLKPGTYRIIISAKGHLTQTKSVTVRDGEQAIFNVDLFPRNR